MSSTSAADHNTMEVFDILPFFSLSETKHDYYTGKNSVISPNFLVRKLCGKAQFPHSFGTRESGETTVSFPVYMSGYEPMKATN